MAVDTREKRSSAIHVGLPWRTQPPAGDSTIDQGDRQQAACLYRGIAAAVPSVFEATACWTLPPRPDVMNLPARSVTWHLPPRPTQWNLPVSK